MEIRDSESDPRPYPFNQFHIKKKLSDDIIRIFD